MLTSSSYLLSCCQVSSWIGLGIRPLRVPQFCLRAQQSSILWPWLWCYLQWLVLSNSGLGGGTGVVVWVPLCWRLLLEWWFNFLSRVCNAHTFKRLTFVRLVPPDRLVWVDPNASFSFITFLSGLLNFVSEPRHFLHLNIAFGSFVQLVHAVGMFFA